MLDFQGYLGVGYDALSTKQRESGGDVVGRDEFMERFNSLRGRERDEMLEAIGGTIWDVYYKDSMSYEEFQRQVSEKFVAGGGERGFWGQVGSDIAGYGRDLWREVVSGDDRLSNVGSGFVDGLVNLGLDSLRGFMGAAEGMGRQMEDAVAKDPDALKAWGITKESLAVERKRNEEFVKTLDELKRLPEAERAGALYKAGQALGSMSAFMVAVPARGGAAALGASANVGQVIDESGGEASAGALWAAAAVGASEALPIPYFKEFIRGAIKGRAGREAAKLGLGVLAEGGQEGAAQYLNNVIASLDYDPSRELSEGVGEGIVLGAGAGGVVAGVGAGVGAGVNRLRGRRGVEPELGGDVGRVEPELGDGGDVPPAPGSDLEPGGVGGAPDVVVGETDFHRAVASGDASVVGLALAREVGDGGSARQELDLAGLEQGREVVISNGELSLVGVVEGDGVLVGDGEVISLGGGEYSVFNYLEGDGVESEIPNAGWLDERRKTEGAKADYRAEYERKRVRAEAGEYGGRDVREFEKHIGKPEYQQTTTPDERNADADMLAGLEAEAKAAEEAAKTPADAQKPAGKAATPDAEKTPTTAEKADDVLGLGEGGLDVDLIYTVRDYVAQITDIKNSVVEAQKAGKLDDKTLQDKAEYAYAREKVLRDFLRGEETLDTDEVHKLVEQAKNDAGFVLGLNRERRQAREADYHKRMEAAKAAATTKTATPQTAETKSRWTTERSPDEFKGVVGKDAIDPDDMTDEQRESEHQEILDLLRKPMDPDEARKALVRSDMEPGDSLTNFTGGGFFKDKLERLVNGEKGGLHLGNYIDQTAYLLHILEGEGWNVDVVRNEIIDRFDGDDPNAHKGQFGVENEGKELYATLDKGKTKIIIPRADKGKSDAAQPTKQPRTTTPPKATPPPKPSAEEKILDELAETEKSRQLTASEKGKRTKARKTLGLPARQRNPIKTWEAVMDMAHAHNRATVQAIVKRDGGNPNNTDDIGKAMESADGKRTTELREQINTIRIEAHKQWNERIARDGRAPLNMLDDMLDQADKLLIESKHIATENQKAAAAEKAKTDAAESATAKQRRDQQREQQQQATQDTDKNFMAAQKANTIEQNAILPPKESELSSEKAPKETVKFANGEKIPVKYMVVPIEQIIDSHSGDNTLLQFRSEYDIGTEQRIPRLLAAFDPETHLGRAKVAIDGAPVIARSGNAFTNGRVELIRQALKQPKKRKLYMDMLESYGYTKDIIKDIKNPILIRVTQRVIPLAEAQELAISSNEDFKQGTAGISNALADAKRIHQNPNSYEHLAAANNMKDGALKFVMEMVGESEQATYLDKNKDGSLEVNGLGETRFEQAMTAFVFIESQGGDSSVGEKLVSDLVGARSDSLARKMSALAFGLFKAQLKIVAGEAHSDYDIVPVVVDLYRLMRKTMGSSNRLNANKFLSNELSKAGGQQDIMSTTTGTAPLIRMVADAFFFEPKPTAAQWKKIRNANDLDVVEVKNYTTFSADDILARARYFSELMLKKKDVTGVETRQASLVGAGRETKIEDVLGQVIRSGKGASPESKGVRFKATPSELRAMDRRYSRPRVPGEIFSRINREQIQENRDGLVAEIRSLADQMLPPDVGVLIRQNMTDRSGAPVGGFYRHADRLIAVSASIDPIGDMHHETEHALEAAGLYTTAETKVLNTMAEKQWIERYRIKERYADLAHADQIREARADAFKDYMRNRRGAPKNAIERIFERIRAFFERLTNYMHYLGIPLPGNPSRVFADVASGRVRDRWQPEPFHSNVPVRASAFEPPLSIPRSLLKMGLWDRIDGQVSVVQVESSAINSLERQAAALKKQAGKDGLDVKRAGALRRQAAEYEVTAKVIQQSLDKVKDPNRGAKQKVSVRSFLMEVHRRMPKTQMLHATRDGMAKSLDLENVRSQDIMFPLKVSNTPLDEDAVPEGEVPDATVIGSGYIQHHAGNNYIRMEFGDGGSGERDIAEWVNWQGSMGAKWELIWNTPAGPNRRNQSVVRIAEKAVRDAVESTARQGLRWVKTQHPEVKWIGLPQRNEVTRVQGWRTRDGDGMELPTVDDVINQYDSGLGFLRLDPGDIFVGRNRADHLTGEVLMVRFNERDTEFVGSDYFGAYNAFNEAGLNLDIVSDSYSPFDRLANADFADIFHADSDWNTLAKIFPTVKEKIDEIRAARKKWLEKNGARLMDIENRYSAANKEFLAEGLNVSAYGFWDGVFPELKDTLKMHWVVNLASYLQGSDHDMRRPPDEKRVVALGEQEGLNANQSLRVAKALKKLQTLYQRRSQIDSEFDDLPDYKDPDGDDQESLDNALESAMENATPQQASDLTDANLGIAYAGEIPYATSGLDSIDISRQTIEEDIYERYHDFVGGGGLVVPDFDSLDEESKGVVRMYTRPRGKEKKSGTVGLYPNTLDRVTGFRGLTTSEAKAAGMVNERSDEDWLWWNIEDYVVEGYQPVMYSRPPGPSIFDHPGVKAAGFDPTRVFEDLGNDGLRKNIGGVFREPAPAELIGVLRSGKLSAFDDALKWIAKNAENEWYRKLAAHMHGQFFGVPVRRKRTGGGSVSANSLSGYYSINLSDNRLTIDTILHEAAHAATYNKMQKWMQERENKDPRALELRKLKGQVTRFLNAEGRKAGWKPDEITDGMPGAMRSWGFKYGMSNTDEFLTMSLTDPEMQYVLQRMEYRDGKIVGWIDAQADLKGKKTAWDKVVELVRRLLNAGPSFNTVLDEVLRQTMDLVGPNPEFAARQNKRRANARVKNLDDRIEIKEEAIASSKKFLATDVPPGYERFAEDELADVKWQEQKKLNKLELELRALRAEREKFDEPRQRTVYSRPMPDDTSDREVKAAGMVNERSNEDWLWWNIEDYVVEGYQPVMYARPTLTPEQRKKRDILKRANKADENDDDAALEKLKDEAIENDWMLIHQTDASETAGAEGEYYDREYPDLQLDLTDIEEAMLDGMEQDGDWYVGSPSDGVSAFYAAQQEIHDRDAEDWDSAFEAITFAAKEYGEEIGLKVKNKTKGYGATDPHHFNVTLANEDSIGESAELRIKDHAYAVGAGKAYGHDAPDGEVVLNDDFGMDKLAEYEMSLNNELDQIKLLLEQRERDIQYSRPMPDDDPADREVKDRMLNAMERKQQPDRIKQWLDKATLPWRQLTRVFATLPHVPKNAQTIARLSVLLQKPIQVRGEVQRYIKQMQKLAGDDMHIITASLALADIIATKRHMPESEMAFGIKDIEQAQRIKEEFDAEIAQKPRLQRAIAFHQREQTLLRKDMVDSGVLSPEQAWNTDYWRRLTLEHMTFYGGLISKQDEKVHGPTKHKKRHGSRKDFYLNYEDSVTAWTYRARMDISIARTLEWIDEQHNIYDQLRKRAIKQNKQRLANAINKSPETRASYLKNQRQVANAFKAFSIQAQKILNQSTNPDDIEKHMLDKMRGIDIWNESDDVMDVVYWATNTKRDKFKPLATTAELVLKATNDRRAWQQEHMPKYINPNSAHELIKAFKPDGDYRSWQADAYAGQGRALTIYTNRTLTEKAAKQVAANAFAAGINLTENTLEAKLVNEAVEKASRQTRIVGGPLKEMILPTDIANTLDNFHPKHGDFFSSTFAPITSNLKIWTLMNPFQVIPYNITNRIGDIDGMLATGKTIAVSSQLPTAAKALIAYSMDPHNIAGAYLRLTAMTPGHKKQHTKAEIAKAKKIQDIVRAAARQGVVMGGPTAIDLNDYQLTKLNMQTNELERAAEAGKFSKYTLGIAKAYFNSAKGASAFLENTPRLAAFIHAYTEMAINNKSHNELGLGSARTWMLDNETDPEVKAGLWSRALLGDFVMLGEAGRWMRKGLVPFWVWLETNPVRYYNTTKNAFIESQRRNKHKSGIKYSAAVTAGIAYRLSRLFYLTAIVKIINHTFFDEEEEELGKRTNWTPMHIITGTSIDERGIKYAHMFQFQGAFFTDILGMFGIPAATQKWFDYREGYADITEIPKVMFTEFGDRIFNSINSLIKTPFEMAIGKSFFPNASDPRNIHDRLEYLASSFRLQLLLDYIYLLMHREKRLSFTHDEAETLRRMIGRRKVPLGVGRQQKLRRFSEYTERKISEEYERVQAHFKRSLRAGKKDDAQKSLQLLINLDPERAVKSLPAFIRSEINPLNRLSNAELADFLANASPETIIELQKDLEYRVKLLSILGILD